MSLQEEQDLRAQLVGLLDGVEVSLAPVAATIRRGRRIRTRRWVSVVIGLAGVAAAAVVLPGLLTGRPGSAGPVAPKHYSITVRALGPIARSGVIAEGVTDGKQWKVVGSYSKVDPTGQSAPFIRAVGAIGTQPFLGVDAVGPSPGEPSVVIGLGGNLSGFTTLFGTVRSEVTSVEVQLPDGERPSLIPVSWGGVRRVAVVLPVGVPIVRAVAYASTRELAYAVPLHGTYFDMWWAPGQVGPARVTKSIGSGVVDGKPWHATAYVGPWGWCYLMSTGFSTCLGGVPSSVIEGRPMVRLTCSPGTAQGSPPAGLVLTASDVRRVVVRFSNGTSATFRPVEVAGTGAFGYMIPAHVRVTSSREYGPRGQLVGSVTGDTVGSQPSPGWSC